jgi:penicillin-binding protein 2
VPGDIPLDEFNDILKKLAVLLNIPLNQLERKLPKQYLGLFQPVEIATNLSYNAIAVLAEHIDSLRGVSWQSKPLRKYNVKGSISHVIGYVGDITRDELITYYNQQYHQGDIIGKAGIERQYDEVLRGIEGNETRTVDVRGRRMAGENTFVRIPPKMGKNIVLSIDNSIQTLAEKALGERMGAVVVTRPATGEILALVSYPYYDPEIFIRSSLNDDYDELINNPNKPFINRAIQSSYPPASTFKVVMTAGILNEEAFPATQTILCPGEIEYGGRVWHCHIGKPGHGRLNLQNALAQSCDIYYWIVGRDSLDIENIISYSNDFGFGSLTGIDLPGEIAGFIPTPGWKDRRFHERWQGGDTMNMSIGQGFTLVTPLQMANMISMVVNDGIIYKSHLLKEIRDPITGAIEKTVTPEVLHKSNIKQEVFDVLKENMRYVVSNGTARYPMNLKSVEIAGKTGTGEVGLQNRWHSWFAAYAPYETDDPASRVVVSIIVEAANQWEWWAPYASAIIFQGIFAGQTYEETIKTLGFSHLFPVAGRRE